MGSDATLLPTGSQRQFTKLLLSGIGVFAIAIAFGQHDRRELLLYDQPEAFAASELAELSLPVGLSQGVGVRRIVRSRILARQISRSGRLDAGQASAPNAGGGVGAGPTIGLPPFLLSNPERSLASAGTPTGEGFGQQGPALTNAVGPETGISPIPSIVPIVPTVPDVTEPVVPAVPEPSSWILMIFGVGALGAVMRLRRYPLRQLVRSH